MDEQLSQVIGECLQAAAYGPFFPDWEFSTLFGSERSEVADIAADWPRVKQAEEGVNMAINNAMVNLIGYPIDSPKQWPQYISVSREELIKFYDQWLALEPSRQGGLM